MEDGDIRVFAELDVDTDSELKRQKDDALLLASDLCLHVVKILKCRNSECVRVRHVETNLLKFLPACAVAETYHRLFSSPIFDGRNSFLRQFGVILAHVAA